MANALTHESLFRYCALHSRTARHTRKFASGTHATKNTCHQVGIGSKKAPAHMCVASSMLSASSGSTTPNTSSASRVGFRLESGGFEFPVVSADEERCR